MSFSLFLLNGVEMNAILGQPKFLLLDTARRLLLCIVQLYWVLILFTIILSWMQPHQHSPLTAVLSELTEPLLKPMRRILKPIGGLDLSPIPVLILLSALIHQFSI
jgi:YggT family protein